MALSARALTGWSASSPILKLSLIHILSDSDLTELNTWTPKLLAALKKVPELTDVSSDQQSQGLAVNLTIDRDAAGRFGITPTNLDAAIYELIGQDEVAQYYTSQNSYHVVMEATPGQQATPDLFNSVYLLSPLTGQKVPLSLFVKVGPPATSSLTVNHQGEFPAATLSFNLAPGVALSQATQVVQTARDKLGAPKTLTGSFQGTAPVSYTHLDVYKRQTLRFWPTAIRASSAPRPAEGKVERIVRGWMKLS